MSVDLDSAREMIKECEKVLITASELANKNKLMMGRLGLKVEGLGLVVHTGTQYVGILGSFSATIDSLKESVEAFDAEKIGASELAFDYLMKDSKYYLKTIKKTIKEYDD